MNYNPILEPVVALVAWSIVVMLWMVATRFAAMRKAGITLANAPRGARGQNLDGVVEERVQWKAHNYAHLMEQPTLFYAIALTLALMEMGDGVNYWLAWGYVVFRVLHSIVQATINKLTIRTPLFVLASLCLLGLTVHAALRIIGD